MLNPRDLESFSDEGGGRGKERKRESEGDKWSEEAHGHMGDAINRGEESRGSRRLQRKSSGKGQLLASLSHERLQQKHADGRREKRVLKGREEREGRRVDFRSQASNEKVKNALGRPPGTEISHGDNFPRRKM